MNNQPQYSYAQSGEDLIILFLAQNVIHLAEVYYLDLGANEPKKLNNTQLLYELGYRGVSVDANSYFQKAYKQVRPEDVFVAAGVGAKDGEETFYEIDPHTLSTFSRHEAESYTKNGNHKIIAKRACPIFTIHSIIERYCLKSPNILSLDVEGLDLEVLKSINFKKWRPAIICVETLTYTEDATEQKNKEILKLLKEKGYLIYADTYINTIFVDKVVWGERK